ncbi:HET-domain-containing protein [Hypoxylon sp. FL1284]|nr:HET-domain-containing protein [Hypoxylon sp. FL1284]
MLRYKYKPLNDPNELRLVTILPGKYQDPIRIQITHATLLQPATKFKPERFSLEEIKKTLPGGWDVTITLEGRILFFDRKRKISSWVHPDPGVPPGAYDAIGQEPQASELNYEALSYVWGPPKRRAKALVIERDDNANSLRSRLKRRYIPLAREISWAIRGLRYEDRSRVMWIDAICINQADTKERSVQVRRMKEIYSLAHRVVAWLGPTCLDSDEAMSILGHIGAQVEASYDYTILPSPGCEEADWFDPDVQLPYETEHWETLSSLFTSEWFKRIWIVQEIQLGNANSILKCGRDEFPWFVFRRAILVLTQKHEGVYSQFRKELISLSQLCEGMVRLPMEQMLYYFCGRRCSEQRDKVYGILGLAPQEIVKHIKIDYGQTLVEVYKQVFLACSEGSQRLALLRYSGLHHDLTSEGQPRPDLTSGWPSWLPNWSRTRSPSTPPTLYFCASGISASRSQPCSPDQLQVTALRVAPVSWFLTDIMIYEDFLSLFLFYTAMRARQMISDYYPTGENVADVLLKTLTLNMLDDRAPGCGYPTLEQVAKGAEIYKNAPKYGKNVAEAGFTSYYRHLLAKTFNYHCVFCTKDGYLGMVRGHPQIGDEVFVVLGVDVPLLLRRTPTGQYQVVSDCYVHGIMDGEALLGPLPPSWKVQIGHDADGSARPYYVHAASGRRTAEDPRLAGVPVPAEWEPVAWERARTDPDSCRKFRSRGTGRVVNADPRLFPEALAARGVRLETITLV